MELGTWGSVIIIIIIIIIIMICTRRAGKLYNARSRLAGWLAGKPDYPQKLKVPEGYEKINENRNI